MKKIAFLTMLVFLTLCVLPLCAQQNADPAGVILNHYAAGNFIAGSIPRADLDKIVQAGIRAPSARNLQPWHFTVVVNQALAKQVLSQNVDGNVYVIVSAVGDGKTNGVQILDCALAVQSINLAAQSMGYGARIYTGQNDRINKDLKTELGLPANHSVVAFVRIGKVSSWVDGVSGASARKKPADVVTYK
jgi:nitroreductase